MTFFIQVFTTLYNNPYRDPLEPSKMDKFHRIPNLVILKKFILLDVKKADEITRHIIQPLQECLKAIEKELDLLEKNGLHRIQLPLHTNKGFYDKMHQFDKY